MNAVFQQLYMQPGLPEVHFQWTVYLIFFPIHYVILSSNTSICDYNTIFFVLGFPVHWRWHRPAWRECFLSSPVSIWPSDGEQTPVLCTWELLEGKSLFTVKSFRNQRLSAIFNLQEVLHNLGVHRCFLFCFFLSCKIMWGVLISPNDGPCCAVCNHYVCKVGVTHTDFVILDSDRTECH